MQHPRKRADRSTLIDLWRILIAVMGVILLRDLRAQSQTIQTIP